MSFRHPPPVITISASYGAGGSIVGPRLAQRLAIPFLDRAIPAAVSARLAVPLDAALGHEELAATTLTPVFEHIAPAVQMFAGAPPPTEPVADDERTFLAATEQVLHEYAARGGVILGRAAAVVLRDVPHALHVRLDGPREQRIVKAMRLLPMDRVSAEEQLRAADTSREAYGRHWYHADARDPLLYHLVIDSTGIDLDGCVDLIALAVQWRQRASMARQASPDAGAPGDAPHHGH